jgi:glycosyltransferase involved in cell wall biosynthesis
MRVLFALPGLHRVVRGAEVAFEELGRQMSRLPGCEVTLIGSGEPIADRPYRFIHAGAVSRERFERLPSIPYFRTHYACEDLTFAPGLMRAYRPADYDVTVTCNYPYTNWVLRARRNGRGRPLHVFVTQNGDWMCRARNSEYRYFGCEGLVCTNPEYYDNNRERWRSTLIPNGVDPSVFHPGPAERGRFSIPDEGPLVLMVSALIPSKRVIEGIQAAARIPDVQMVVAGDGELRREVQETGQRLLGSRFRRLSLPRRQMPHLYRCADVYLHMSQDEPSANAYIEALASGLPIVTHDRRVTRWTLVDQAVLVDTSDEQAVAEGIRRALEQRGGRHVEARRELVERRFAWSALARQYCDFFQELEAEAA